MARQSCRMCRQWIGNVHDFSDMSHMSMISQICHICPWFLRYVKIMDICDISEHIYKWLFRVCQWFIRNIHSWRWYMTQISHNCYSRSEMSHMRLFCQQCFTSTPNMTHLPRMRSKFHTYKLCRPAIIILLANIKDVPSNHVVVDGIWVTHKINCTRVTREIIVAHKNASLDINFLLSNSSLSVFCFSVFDCIQDGQWKLSN